MIIFANAKKGTKITVQFLLRVKLYPAKMIKTKSLKTQTTK